MMLRHLPANAALTSDVEPVSATALLLRVMFPEVPLLIATNSARVWLSVRVAVPVYVEAKVPDKADETSDDEPLRATA